MKTPAGDRFSRPCAFITECGGGYFPHYLGRLDRNTGSRATTVKNAGGKKPSDTDLAAVAGGNVARLLGMTIPRVH